MLGNTSDLMHDDRLLCGRQSQTSNISCGSRHARQSIGFGAVDRSFEARCLGSDLRWRESTWRDRQDARELDKVRGRIADHAYDLLPTGIVSTDKLLEARESLSAAIAEEQKQGGEKELLANVQAGWDDLDPMSKRVLNCAQLELAYLWFRKRVRALSLLALRAMARLAIYAWAANPKPEKEDESHEEPAPVTVAPVAWHRPTRP
jgi:hypothetical protein